MEKLSRRRFLEDTLLALTAAAIPVHAEPAGVAYRGRKTGPNDTIRIAVLGVHGRGISHLEAWNSMNDVAIAAICDPDMNTWERAVQAATKGGKQTPYTVQDMRRIFDDKNIDAVSIATQNHWHALAAIWAMQSGKDVYVEKPVSHNVSEGRRIVEAARKYNRICQAGTQSRSSKGLIEAMAFLHEGGLGKIHLARALCYKRRTSIGIKPDGPVPPGVDYDLWLGPAPVRPFNPNRFHYNWHWNWDYGNGDIGNQGVHEMDKARWGLNKSQFPKNVLSLGGRFGYVDDGQTPNTQLAFFDYGDAHLIFEVRGLETPALQPVPGGMGAKIGNIFYGTKGVMVIPDYGSAYVYDTSGNLVKEFKGGGDHFRNFIDAMRSRNYRDLHAEILDGHLSSALCHLANISYRLGELQPFDPKTKAFGDDREAYDTFGRFEDHLAANGIDLKAQKYRLGRKLAVDAAKESFRGDPEAVAMLTRNYRPPFVVPSKV